MLSNRRLLHHTMPLRSEGTTQVRSNRSALEEALSYHSALLDSLAAHQGQVWTPSPRLFTRGFVSPAHLSHTAWESASQTGALAHMQYATVLRLSRLYAQQDRYAEQTRSIAQILYSELYRGGPGAVVSNHRNLAAIIGTFRYRERQLLGVYDENLAALAPSRGAR